MTITDGTTFTSANAGGSAIFQFGVGAAANNFITIAYRFNIGAIAPATVTMNLVGGTDQFANILCNAFTDTAVPTPDGTCSFQTNSSTATSQCTAAITTTGRDYVLGLGVDSAGVVTQGAGWTLGSNSGGASNEYQVQTAAGSINPQFINQTVGQLQGVLGFAVKP
jgi:hypothetical protein